MQVHLCTVIQLRLGRVSKTGNGQISATNHRFGMSQTTRCIGEQELPRWWSQYAPVSFLMAFWSTLCTMCTFVYYVHFVLILTQYCQQCTVVHKCACLVMIYNIVCTSMHFCSIWPGASVENWKWANLSNQPSVWDEPNNTLYR